MPYKKLHVKQIENYSGKQTKPNIVHDSINAVTIKKATTIIIKAFYEGKD